MNERGDLHALLLLAGVWAAVIASVGLGGDFALNDDWAYAWTARHLLHTGELRILDWSAPTLATHALWGAAVLRVFGDSYVALRCGTLAWALCALALLYALIRSVSSTRTALLVCLATALSPWFVNLSFTYMTDVPWLALVLASILAFVRALDPRASAPPKAALLALSGALVGAAATTRQIAIVTTPAFALALAFDARRRSPRAWRSTMGAPPPNPGSWLPSAVRGCLWLGAPAGAIFLPFYRWYTHVHGATLAARETFERIADVRPWDAFILAMSVLHYAALWIFPLALAILLARRRPEVSTRRQAVWGLVWLGGYALLRPLLGRLLDPRGPGFFDHPAEMLHPLMPYLGNVFYLLGLGPPTFTDTYLDFHAPSPHAAVWLGVVLTMASTLAGTVGAGLLVTTLRRVRLTWALPEPAAAAPDHRRALLRVLLVAWASAYVLFQVCTSKYIFDRYLLPLLPMISWLALDALAPAETATSAGGAERASASAPLLDVARSPALVGCLVVCGLFSVAGTREYMSRAVARDQAVRALVARGVPPADIDGGFEVNAPHHLEAYLKRTGQLLGPKERFWVEHAPYRLTLRGARERGCVAEERYPYWTWPGGGDPAVTVLHCEAPAH